MRPAINMQQPMWKTFLMFLVPMMMANILQSLSGTLNNIYLGQMIGVQALAAASAFFPLMLFLISFVMGLGSGASVLIGQAWGAKQPERVRAIAGTTLTVGVLGGLAVALFGGTFAHLLLGKLDTPPDIMVEATAYSRVMLYAMPGFFAFMLLTSIMRGVGDTVTPLYALIVSTIVGLHRDAHAHQGLVRPAAVRRHQRRHRRVSSPSASRWSGWRFTCAARATCWRSAPSSRVISASTAPSSSRCCASAFPLPCRW